jgi:hypothetical protein
MCSILTDYARARLFPREPGSNTIQAGTAEAFERYLNKRPTLQDLPGCAPYCRLQVHRDWSTQANWR